MASPPHPNNVTLLLGASGILGTEMRSLLGTSNVIATHFGRPRAGSIFFDARTMDVNTLWAQGAVPSSAIVMLGVTNIDACARDPEVTARTNVEGVLRVVDQLCEAGIAPVFVSSDGVFDGSRAWWDESDEVSPILEYGRQKLLVERRVADLGGLAVRLPKLLEDEGSTGFLPGWLQALGQPAPLLCATDQFFTPASARDVAAAIAALVKGGARGLYHVAGPQRISRRELLDEVVQEYSRFAFVAAPIEDCLLGDVPVFERRPLDTSMRTARLKDEFGLELRSAAAVARTAVQKFFSAARKQGPLQGNSDE